MTSASKKFLDEFVVVMVSENMANPLGEVFLKGTKTWENIES